jgi:NTE family protein
MPKPSFLEGVAIENVFKLLPRLFGADIPRSLRDKINIEAKAYSRNLYYDYGLFSGCGFHTYAHSEIGAKTAEKARKKRKKEKGMKYMVRENMDVTFGEFLDIHEIDLVLTGTNMETMESKYFCAKETPDFNVADAMRISMSFPLAYKPVIIRSGEFSGTWVDGGVMNNNPMHAFDTPNGEWNKNVLSLRLEIDQRNSINNFLDFLNALKKTIMSNSEKLQIRSLQQKSQTIELPTDGLSTLDFTPPVDVIKRSVENSAAQVTDYFGKGVTTEVIDWVLDKI